MICPYCNDEMELGVIQSQHEINWSNKRRFLSSSAINDDVVVLSEFSFLRGSVVEAYLCRKCRKVMIDFDDSDKE
ncbi:MAG: hypothetical protein IJ455_00015 [Agathobacter sp.]|nr:hypothetical protein [Agathobacter sp.]